MTAYIRKQYPDSHIVLLGHSMGSFVSRQYITQYGSKIDGAILMGTGDPGKLKVAFGLALHVCFAVIFTGAILLII